MFGKKEIGHPRSTIRNGCLLSQILASEEAKEKLRMCRIRFINLTNAEAKNRSSYRAS